MTSTPTPARLPAWAPFVVLIAAFVAQAAVLQGAWLLDDGSVIRGDADIARGPAGIQRLFARGTLGGDTERGAYRPLMLASFALEAPLWEAADGGLDPFGFHLTNLLLHAIAALLLLSVLLRLMPERPLVALGAAVAFGVHPMNTGTVGSLLGRADLLALVFALAAARLWVKREGLPSAGLAWVGLFTFLALMAKEVALALPIVLFLLDRFRADAPGLRERLPAYGVLAFVGIVYLILWPGPAEGSVDLPHQGVGTAMLLALAGVARMVLRFVLPVGYRGDHSDEALGGEGYIFEGATAAAGAAVAVLAVAALVVVVRGRRSALAEAWLVTVAAALVAAATLPAGRALELRFAYVVGAPLFVVAGLVLHALVAAAKAPALLRHAGQAGAVVLLLALAGLSHVEARAWHDDRGYHDRLLRESPGHVAALVRQARLKRLHARSLQRRAGTLPVADAEGRPNNELVRLRAERDAALRSATGWLQRALSRPTGRKLASAWAELAYVRLARAEPADALLALDEAKRLDPVLQRAEGVALTAFSERQLAAAAAVFHAEGTCRLALGDTERAAGAFQSAVDLQPTNSELLRDAAMAFMGLRRWGEGLPLMRQAIRHATSSGERAELEALLARQEERARELAARLYLEGERELAAGNREAALERYQAAFLADPGHVDAYIRAARIIGSYLGNYARGNKYLLEAERLVKSRSPLDKAKLDEIRTWRRHLAKRKQEDDEELRREMEGPGPAGPNRDEEDGDGKK